MCAGRAGIQAVMLLQAVAAALSRSRLEPVLAKIAQKRMMLMTLTTCARQLGSCTYDLEFYREMMPKRK